MRILTGIIGFFLILATTTVFAESLFSGRIEVADETRDVRNAAANLALVQVVKKLTGAREIAQSEWQTMLAGKASLWIEKFHYEQIEMEDGLVQKFLHAEFNDVAIVQALTEMQVPIWPKRPPVILAWIGFDDGQTREIVNVEDYPDMVATLKSAAAERGITLSFPILDINERLMVSVADVWGQFAGPINDASIRYAPDVQLWGKVFKNLDSQWEVSWALKMVDQLPNWAIRARNLDEILSSSMDSMVDYLLPVYARVRSTAEVDAYVVHFKGVKNYETYRELARELRAQSAVKLVTVNEINQESLALNISLEGDRTTLQQLLDRFPQLTQDDAMADQYQLMYRLQ